MAFRKCRHCSRAGELDIQFDSNDAHANEILASLDLGGFEEVSAEYRPYSPPPPPPPDNGLVTRIDAAAWAGDRVIVAAIWQEIKQLPDAWYWTSDSPSALHKAMYLAVKNKHRSVIDFILAQGFRPTTRDAQSATEQRDTELLETFLIHGWGINDRFHSEGTSLLKGVLREPDLRTWFLDHGADPNIPGERDETALSEVVRYGPFDMIRQFFDDHGACATIGFQLHRAVWREREDQLEIIAFLLQKGADVNQILHQDTIWYFREMLCGLGTPLHEAAEQGKLDVARLLVEHDANPLIQDSCRSTALQLAEKAGHADMVAFLADVMTAASAPAYQYNRGERGPDWGAI